MARNSEFRTPEQLQLDRLGLAEESEIRPVITMIEQLAEESHNAASRWQPVSHETAVAAQQLVARMRWLVDSNAMAWTVPHVGTDGEGAISLEWWHGRCTLTLYAYCGNRTESLLAWGADPDSEMESLEDLSDRQLLELWQRCMTSE